MSRFIHKSLRKRKLKLRTFLGLPGYYHNFVQRYGSISKSSIHLLKKKICRIAILKVMITDSSRLNPLAILQQRAIHRQDKHVDQVLVQSVNLSLDLKKLLGKTSLIWCRFHKFNLMMDNGRWFSHQQLML